MVRLPSPRPQLWRKSASARPRVALRDGRAYSDVGILMTESRILATQWEGPTELDVRSTATLHLVASGQAAALGDLVETVVLHTRSNVASPHE